MSKPDLLPLDLPPDTTTDQYRRILDILRESTRPHVDRGPWIVGYVRISRLDARIKANAGIDGEQPGLSIPEQIETIDHYRDYVISKTPGLTKGPIYIDREVSAIKLQLMNRPNGRKMLMEIQPGDHMVFRRLDRGFRKMVDCLTWMERWDKQGIVTHFCDMSLDSSSPEGQLLIKFRAFFAEYEGALITERNRAIAARCWRRTPECRHLPRGNGQAIGYTKKGKPGRKYLAPANGAMFCWMGWLRQLREEGKGYWTIARMATREASTFHDSLKWRDRVWDMAVVRRWYLRAVELGIPPLKSPRPEDNPAFEHDTPSPTCAERPGTPALPQSDKELGQQQEPCLETPQSKTHPRASDRDSEACLQPRTTGL